MAYKVFDDSSLKVANGATEDDIQNLQDQIDNIDPSISLTGETVTINNGKTVIYCNKLSNLIIINVRCNQQTFSAGRTNLGTVIPAAYRPDVSLISGLTRPVRVNDQTITNTTMVEFEINSSGQLIAFTNEGLGDGWITSGNFVFVKAN